MAGDRHQWKSFPSLDPALEDTPQDHPSRSSTHCRADTTTAGAVTQPHLTALSWPVAMG